MAGMETMRGLRAAKRKDGGAKLREKDLCSGPSKLCQALAISKEEINLQKMFDSEHIWLEGTWITRKNIEVMFSTDLQGVPHKMSLSGFLALTDVF